MPLIKFIHEKVSTELDKGSNVPINMVESHSKNVDRCNTMPLDLSLLTTRQLMTVQIERTLLLPTIIESRTRSSVYIPLFQIFCHISHY